MSTRAFVIIKDQGEQVNFYRHSDGYPDCTGADLADFVKDYESGAMRADVMQSSGWLVLRGAFEYSSDDKPLVGRASQKPRDSYQWKVGAYEPSGPALPGDIEYLYVIDLEKRELTCRQPKKNFWDNATIENTALNKAFKKVAF